MAKYLTQEWLDEYRALAEHQPIRAGATAVVQYVITDGPDGTVAYHWTVTDGRLADAQIGTVPDPDFTWTATYQTQVAIHRGELDANTAFMRNRAKVTGDMTRFIRMLPITGSPEFGALLRHLRSNTEF
ncbi:MAG: SCP2 sterol-binding domain-containing protein [Actinomycetes bacterium]